MMQLKPQWQHLADRVDAMSLRERILIFLAAALVLITLANTLLIKPLLTRQRAMSQQIVLTQAQTSALQAQIQTMVKAGGTDPDAALRARMAELQAKSAESDKALRDIQSGLVSPQQMPTLLEDILQRNRALRLVSLKTLPIQDLAATLSSGDTKSPGKQTQEGTASELAVFKQGVEITVEGNYLDLLRYLTAMESSPWRMFWGNAELSVNKYPEATLTLRLYTLSLDKAWLAI
jgi:MSHA biogenesis protein MshJ